MGEVIDLGADAAEFVVAIRRRTAERPGTMEIVDIVDTNFSLVETILKHAAKTAADRLKAAP